MSRHAEDESAPVTYTSSLSYTFHPIGVTSSVFRLCVGTPRQGLLAPNARAKINLDTRRIAAESVLDLQLYSHIWVVFVFHLNTHSSKDTRDPDDPYTQFPAKIAPPALGGKKVGVFSTRTPHRPNPIGMTLCKLDKITQHHTELTLHVSGVDLVDGTPVLDIKPFVPHYDTWSGLVPSCQDTTTSSVCLPPWVQDGLDKRRSVYFTSEAMNQLDHIVSREDECPLLFYGVATGRDESKDQCLVSIQACIEQVLAVDVRSAWNTRKVRRGQFQAEKTARVRELLQRNGDTVGQEEDGVLENGIPDLCSQQLDRLLIYYWVERGDAEKNVETRINTDGSGADDRVTVYQIEYLNTV
jgi:tRNA-Thr(GGU) m(6)t(6)A37 methyltransferase TsaA